MRLVNWLMSNATQTVGVQMLRALIALTMYGLRTASS